MTLETLETERQLVVFDLARESYGVDISSVREIIRMQDITQVPRTPNFVRGVIDLRGRVIPVVDLRNLFGFDLEDATMATRIVVVDIAGQDIGVVVDAVNEVLRISASAVEPPSSVIITPGSEFLLGIVKLPTRLIIFLDLEQALSEIDTSGIMDKANKG